MRQDIIDQLKQSLQDAGQLGASEQEMKEKALLLGATEDEFQASLNKTDKPQMVKDAKIKQLLRLDLAAHAVLLITILGLATYFLLTMQKSEGFTDTASYSLHSPTKGDILLAQPAFAKTNEIDASQVFSTTAPPITLTYTGKPKKEIYGYFPYWMLSNQHLIPVEAVTTLSLFGLDITPEGNIVTGSGEGGVNGGWQMWTNPTLQTLLDRANKRDIKVELAFKSFSNDVTDSLTQNDKAQEVFITNAIHLVQSKSLDGINLDFEYHGIPPEPVRTGYTRLVRNLKAEMSRQIPNATLTLSTYVTEAAVSGLINITSLQDSVDSFVVMGYDFSTPSGPAGPVAPLDGTMSITGFLQSYLEKIPSEKVILAVPYYGYDWKKDSTERSDHRSLPYATVLEESKNYPLEWDEIAQTPFYNYIDPVTNAARIVYFENVRSLGLKYDYINKKNLKGVGIWALGYDGKHRELLTLLQNKFVQ